MSTDEIIKEREELLLKNWTTDEKEIINRLIDNMVTYRRIISKSVKKDVTDILKIANHIKAEYDIIKDKDKNVK